MVEHLTPIQQLALVKRTVGEPLTLRLGEELISTYISDTTVMVAIQTVKIREYTVGYKVTAEGTKFLTWQLQADGTWLASRMVTWEPDFKPYEVGTRGGKSLDEALVQREWEDDCYRPGNGTRLGQRDNADRVFQGYDYSEPQFYTTQTTQKG